jgi:hypothetical protein
MAWAPPAATARARARRVFLHERSSLKVESCDAPPAGPGEAEKVTGQTAQVAQFGRVHSGMQTLTSAGSTLPARRSCHKCPVGSLPRFLLIRLRSFWSTSPSVIHVARWPRRRRRRRCRCCPLWSGFAVRSGSCRKRRRRRPCPCLPGSGLALLGQLSLVIANAVAVGIHAGAAGGALQHQQGVGLLKRTLSHAPGAPSCRPTEAIATVNRQRAIEALVRQDLVRVVRVLRFRLTRVKPRSTCAEARHARERRQVLVLLANDAGRRSRRRERAEDYRDPGCCRLG